MSRRSSTAGDDEQKSLSLKKRWLAHHHDDQQQVTGAGAHLQQLLREHSFHDWQTIAVLVESAASEYIAGKIQHVGANGSLTVQTDDALLEVNVLEKIFAVLSDNAPSIQDLVDGKLILCKKQSHAHVFHTATIVGKTTEGKYQIVFRDHDESLCVPRQSIRLFLPPWHDGEFRRRTALRRTIIFTCARVRHRLERVAVPNTAR